LRRIHKWNGATKIDMLGRSREENYYECGML
jgi:hypothetical protein